MTERDKIIAARAAREAAHEKRREITAKVKNHRLGANTMMGVGANHLFDRDMFPIGSVYEIDGKWWDGVKGTWYYDPTTCKDVLTADDLEFIARILRKLNGEASKILQEA